MTAPGTEWTLTHGGQVLRLDPATGLPAEVGLGDRTLALDTGVELTSGGGERRAPLGGLEYPGAATDSALTALGRPEPAGRGWTVAAELAGWRVDWTYRPPDQGPGWSMAARLRPTPSARDLRGLAVRLAVRLPGAARWRLDAPGNRLRPGVALAELTRPVGIAGLTGLRGSPGLVSLTAPDASHALLLWPDSVDELSAITVAPDPGGLMVTVDTGLAAAADDGTDVALAVTRLGLLEGGWREHRDRVAGWYAGLGIRLPSDRPPWTGRATIYEAQVGYSVFGPDGWAYSPYPAAADLLADLPRIRDLGFDTVQLMPRQPYPSYNVHDYADVTTSYGEEEVVAAIVRTAHDLGMRVILDVIMHGVVDRESVDSAVAGVLAGPYAARLGEATEQTIGVDLLDTDPHAIAWSRHILDFAPHWRAGSPDRHPLCDEHPDWFCTDSAGRITGIYTKAFDLSSPGWRRYFTDAMVALVQRLDIDGFRFDAPTYNAFASWSPAARRRASAPTAAAVGLFAEVRERLAAAKPGLMMYTEPSGPALRQSMDLNYNYDEQWLIPAVMTRAGEREPWLISCAADLAAWLAERDRTLPAGAATAHHLDSHDTFWWPLPGAKWRREQYGLAATEALYSVFALCGGAFMSFVGAETGIEDHVRRVNRMRAERPEIRDGAADFDAVRVDDRDVFAVVRRPPTGPPALVLVNLSAGPVRCVAAVRDWPPAGTARLPVSMDPYQTLVLSPDPR